MNNKIYIKDKEVVFNNVPRPILSKFRPVYKVAHIVIILYMSCRNKTSTLLKLSFFNWIIKSQKNINLVRDIFDGHVAAVNIKIILEPSFERALLLCMAEGFIEVNQGKYKLTYKGIELAKDIIKDKNLLVEEKKFLKHVKTKIGEKKVKSLLETR